MPSRNHHHWERRKGSSEGVGGAAGEMVALQYGTGPGLGRTMLAEVQEGLGLAPGWPRSLLVSVLLLAITYVGVLVTRSLRRIRHMRAVSKDIPGPPTLPLVGNLLDVIAGGDDRIYENCCRLADKYGTTMRVWLGPELVVSVSDPRDVEFVATSQELIDKSHFYDVLEPLLGRGLSCLGGTEIRRHRKIVTPSLHLDILHDFIDVFNRRSMQFARRLEEFANTEKEFDVSPICLEFSLGSALETVMTTDMKDDDEGMRAFRESLYSAMDLFMYRVCKPWYLDDRVFRVSSRYASFKQTMRTLNGFTERVIAEKRRQIRSKVESRADGPRKRRRAFLDNILDNPEGAALTDLELRDEVKTLLCTGTETSASTLSFILKVLSLRQDIQDRLQQELDDVFSGDADRPVTLEELPHLQYTERVVKETLRMFPVLPFFTRKCPRDVALPSGYTAPRGAHLVFFLPRLHMDPDSFPDPENFDPDRFLPEVARERHPFSYLPFSAGPRNCVGQRYAMMLLKVELATLLRQFRILPPPGAEPQSLSQVPIKVTLVIAVKGGVRICVRRRAGIGEALARDRNWTKTTEIPLDCI